MGSNIRLSVPRLRLGGYQAAINLTIITVRPSRTIVEAAATFDTYFEVSGTGTMKVAHVG